MLLRSKIESAHLSETSDSPFDTQQQKVNQSNKATKLSLEEKIKRITEPLLRSLGLELFEIQYSGSRRGGQLRIFIDKEEGIGVDDCMMVSRYLGPALDVGEVIQGKYTLEVSSPGLNRPLRHKADYQRFLGRRIRIKTYEKMSNQKNFVGQLKDFRDETVFLCLDQGEACQIALAKIASARLEVDLEIELSRGGSGK